MKWSEIKRRLKKYGCYKFKEGGNHEKWKSPITGKIHNVGRHNNQDAPKDAAIEIFKEMGVPMYDD